MSDNTKIKGSENVQKISGMMSKIEIAMTDEIRLAHEMYGRSQMAAGLAKLVTVADTIELQKIKESKAYKHLANPEALKKGNSFHFFNTWADFCRVIVGCDRKTVDERIINLKTFGQEAIDGMNTIGLGVRQLRQLRQLPEDQLEQAKVLAKEKDVESLKDLIEEQAVDKAKLKEALEEARDEVKFYAAKTSDKDEKINQLQADLAKRKKHILGWESKVDDMNIAITYQSGLAGKHLDNLDLLLDEMMHLDIAEDHKEAALATLACTYIAGAKNRLIQVDAMWNKAMGLIGAYEDRALPLLDQKLAEQEQEQK